MLFNLFSCENYCCSLLTLLVTFLIFKTFIWKIFAYFNMKQKFHKIMENTAEKFSIDEKDVVYLFQFHRTASMPNPSPFCLKVETFLRFHKINYKPVFTNFIKRSKQGLLPFIVLNGEEIADSQFILIELEKRFNLKPNLSPENAAIARIADRTIDNSLANAIFYFKIIKNKEQVREVFNRLLPGFLATISFNHVYTFTKNRLRSLKFSTLPESDIQKGLELDLEAFNELLGNKPFLFGDEPTTADFGLFAHLCTMYYNSYNQPLKDILDKQFPKLQKFTERMLTEIFPEYRMYY